MIEIARVLEWIHDALASDATITGLVGDRIYDGIAPEGASFPYIVYNYQGGADAVAVGAIRVLNQSVYQIKAVDCAQSYSGAAQIADQIDNLLQAATGATIDGQILGTNREQPIMYAEVNDKQQYRHAGGLYRIFAQEF